MACMDLLPDSYHNKETQTEYCGWLQPHIWIIAVIQLQASVALSSHTCRITSPSYRHSGLFGWTQRWNSRLNFRKQQTWFWQTLDNVLQCKCGFLPTAVHGSAYLRKPGLSLEPPAELEPVDKARIESSVGKVCKQLKWSLLGLMCSITSSNRAAIENPRCQSYTTAPSEKQL